MTTGDRPGSHSGNAGPARWIDAHCHLQGQYLGAGGSLAECLVEAQVAGVVGLVCVGTDLQTSIEAVAVAHAVRQTAPIGGWATMGIHPHRAGDDVTLLAEAVQRAVGQGDPVVAIGECGLDYHYNHAEPADQRRTFADQIALAYTLGLALVIHTRQAWDDTIDILQAVGAPERTIIHCFTGGPEEARRCLDLGAYLSFSGIATFKNAPEVRQAAALCPVDRLLVETDAPFLAPVPHRGQENRPAWVSVVGEAIAQVRGVAPTVLSDTTRTATHAAFQLS